MKIQTCLIVHYLKINNFIITDFPIDIPKKIEIASSVRKILCFDESVLENKITRAISMWQRIGRKMYDNH